jgi:hypothetical protein
VKGARSISASQTNGPTHGDPDRRLEAPAFVFDQSFIDALSAHDIGLRPHLASNVTFGGLAR